MAFRIRKPSQESFFALNAIPLYSYAIPLVRRGSLAPKSDRLRLFHKRGGSRHPAAESPRLTLA